MNTGTQKMNLLEYPPVNQEYTKDWQIPVTYFGQCIYKKTFSEARVNLEVCSYLADEPSLADGAPINRA